jgi:O-antigen ligase
MKPDRSLAILAAIFCLGLLLTPWWIGGNLPGVRTTALALICLISIGFVLFARLLGTPTRLEIVTKLLLTAGICYSLIQLVALDGSAISIYPPATRERVSVLILAVGVFFCACHIFRHGHFAAWLMGAVAFNGVLITLLGLAQTISDSDKVYWSYELVNGGQPFGPFVNGNNAGGYLIMCFAAANFFLAARVFRTITQQDNRRSSRVSLPQKLIQTAGRGFAKMDARSLYMLAALAVTSAGVFASLSRGASVSLVVAIIVGWAMLFRRNILQGVIAVLVIAAGLALIVWTQQSEVIASNMATFSDVQATNANRLSHWGDGWNYAVSYLPLGSGLGTYNMAYVPFQDTDFNRWFKYAENQYLETFAELGVVGLTILLSVLICGMTGCLWLLGKPDAISRAVGLTGVIAIAGQATAAFFDFGWFIPANMFLFATLMGCVFGQLNWSWSAANIAHQTPRLKTRLLARALMLALAIASAWACYEYSAVDAREACRRFYERFDPVKQADEVDFYNGLAKYAVQTRPDDARAHYFLALNHVLQYRLAVADRMVVEMNEELSDSQSDTKDPASEAEVEEITNQQSPTETVNQSGDSFTFIDAWQRSTLTSTHRLARASQSAGEEYLNQLKDSPEVKDHLVPAWQEIQQAKKLCDCFWYVDMISAQLALLMGDDDSEQKHIENAIKRSNNNTESLYLAGVLQLQSGDTDAALISFHKCLELTRKFEAQIIYLCRNEVGVRDFFERVLPAEPYFRLRIAQKYFGLPADLLLRKWLLRDTEAKLNQFEHSKAERYFLRGEIERLSENHSIAVTYFNEALKLEKHQVKWRIQLARSLIKAGMFTKAGTELKICELYPGDHSMTVMRLNRQLKRLRKEAFENRFDSNKETPN